MHLKKKKENHNNRGGYIRSTINNVAESEVEDIFDTDFRWSGFYDNIFRQSGMVEL